MSNSPTNLDKPDLKPPLTITKTTKTSKGAKTEQKSSEMFSNSKTKAKQNQKTNTKSKQTEKLPTTTITTKTQKSKPKPKPKSKTKINSKDDDNDLNSVDLIPNSTLNSSVTDFKLSSSNLSDNTPGPTGNNSAKKNKSSTKRTKTGCFPCRRRKKKCDEAFPVCSGCSRNFLECVWPTSKDETLPKNFEVFPTTDTNMSLKMQTSSSVFKNDSSSDGEDMNESDGFPPPDMCATIQLNSYIHNEPTELESAQPVPELKVIRMSLNNVDITNQNINNVNDDDEDDIVSNTEVKIQELVLDTEHEDAHKNHHNHDHHFDEENLDDDNMLDSIPEFDDVNSKSAINSPSLVSLSSINTPESNFVAPPLDESIGEDCSSYTQNNNYNDNDSRYNYQYNNRRYDNQHYITDNNNNNDSDDKDVDYEFCNSDDNDDYRMGGALSVTKPPYAPFASKFGKMDINLSSFKTNWIPNYELNNEKAFLYHRFLNQFIPSISVNHAYPALSPGTTFVPYASGSSPGSSAVREIFFACGALTLALDNPDSYSDLASKYYSKAMTLVKDEISKAENITEDWLFVAVQTLCLLDRALGFGANRCTKHLLAASNIIKERLKSKYVTAMNSNVTSSLEITKVEKTLFDSFMFNYTISLYFCDFSDLVQLPSPFTFFDECRSYINAALIIDPSCPSWTNNPVMGSAVGCFECFAKLFWILRMMNPKISMMKLSKLQTETLLRKVKYQIDLTEKSIESFRIQLNQIKYMFGSKKIYEFWEGNLSISTVLFHAVQILYMKLSNPNLKKSDPKIQYHINELMEQYHTKIPINDHSKCLSVSALFIAGTAANDEIQKKFIVEELNRISKLLYTRSFVKLSNKLESMYKDEELNLVSTFDILLSRDGLENLSF
ncbi:hypothetical protein B5S31_g1877 [[Candida] boidinii]|nr:hypothetical protein B5S31_g1877 [[Candida] boidinii]